MLGVDHLGHNISSKGIWPLATIREFGRLVTTRGLQTYLGMVNFYRRFLQGAAVKVLRPLMDKLKGGAKGQLWQPLVRPARRLW